MSFLSIRTVPGPVQNLNCIERSSPNNLFISWEEPTLLGSEVVGYRVEVKGLKHRDGTRNVMEFTVEDFNVKVSEAFVNQGLGGQLLLMLLH